MIGSREALASKWIHYKEKQRLFIVWPSSCDLYRCTTVRETSGRKWLPCPEHSPSSTASWSASTDTKTPGVTLRDTQETPTHENIWVATHAGVGLTHAGTHESPLKLSNRARQRAEPEKDLRLSSHHSHIFITQRHPGQILFLFIDFFLNFVRVKPLMPQDLCCVIQHLVSPMEEPYRMDYFRNSTLVSIFSFLDEQDNYPKEVCVHLSALWQLKYRK